MTWRGTFKISSSILFFYGYNEEKKKKENAIRRLCNLTDVPSMDGFVNVTAVFFENICPRVSQTMQLHEL